MKFFQKIKIAKIKLVDFQQILAIFTQQGWKFQFSGESKIVGLILVMMM